ncbi:MAG: 23S rRNA (pseudouridine(1915)-N(3))-methyltransferase RlmH [Oscillospiraceae bacterium]|nr:23S rRNA (pseudouridine(1915)-N(3))-methyltransferase RlmH [Oscillospiraceae bacterium]
MLNIHILAVGKLGQDWLAEGCAHYRQLISPYFKLQITELPAHRLPSAPSQAQVEKALAVEGEQIRARLPKGGFAIPLCVEGEQLSSEKLAALLERCAGQGQPPAFIIGSSHGLCPELKRQASLRLSLSDMTFPHQLARVMLLEQIYRGGCILRGGKYHK